METTVEAQSVADESIPTPAIPEREIPPPASFNGRLDTFSYVFPVSSSAQTNALDTPLCSRPILSSLKRKVDKTSPTPPTKRRTTRSSSHASSSIPATTAPKLRRKPSSSPLASTPSLSKSKTSPEKYTSYPNLLRDSIPPNLILLFIGVNPGLTTALTGHAYAHPSNLFWKLLYSSGITPTRCQPSDTYRLAELYNLGNTNIVARPTKDASELSKKEMEEGVAVLEEKILDKKPEAVCIVGKSIWETIWRVRKGWNIKKEEFKYGWQEESENMGRAEHGGVEEGWPGAKVFVATTTSGLAAGMRPPEKEAIWRELGIWVERWREERKNGPELQNGSAE